MRLPTTKDTLAVMGTINWDTTMFVDKVPRPGEESTVLSVEEFPGGKGANTAVACARILGPGRVAIIGAVGDDGLSSKQTSSLEEEGVLTDGLVRLKGKKSGRAFVSVDGSGSKAINTFFGANDLLEPRHLDLRGPAGVIDRVKTLIVMDVPLPVACAAAVRAGRRGAMVIYSPGVRSKGGLRPLEAVLERCDVLVVDEEELENLAGVNDFGRAVREVSGRCRELTFVVTRGRLGAVSVRERRVERVPGVRLSNLGLRPVNSTGSGDAFLGAYASFVTEGFPHSRSLGLANLAGALKATKKETRGSPRRRDLESAAESLGRFRPAQPA